MSKLNLRDLFSFVIILFSTQFSGICAAQDVQLQLDRGGLTIAGALVHFDGKSYVIDSEVFGIISLGADKFTCLGEACPNGPGELIEESPPQQQQSTALAIDDAATHQIQTLKISGSSLIASHLMPSLLGRYAKSINVQIHRSEGSPGSANYQLIDKYNKRNLAITLESQDLATAFIALASGEAQISMADRPISRDEIGIFAQAGIGNITSPQHEHVIGVDAVTIFTSNRNVISSLSIEELSKIFSGQIQNWSAFGLPDNRINLYVPDDQSGTFLSFKSLVLDPYQKTVATNATRLSSKTEIIKRVSNDPHAIGVAGLTQHGLAKPIAVKNSCGHISAPSEFNIKTGDYPLLRPLYLYAKDSHDPQIAKFLYYASSPTAGAALRDAGYIDRDIVEVPYETIRDRMANSLIGDPKDFDLELFRQLMRDLRDGRRLSATLRFETRSARLDAESVQSLLQLVQYLENTPMDGWQITLAGFADSWGNFSRNRGLSQLRANAVRDALLTVANGSLTEEQIVVKGYSELVPVACNDSEAGRHMNRRVEVWLTPSKIMRPVVLIERL